MAIDPAPAPRTERSASARRLSRAIAFAVVGMAAVVAAGWILDVRLMKGFLPALISMKINTAVGASAGVTRLERAVNDLERNLVRMCDEARA